MKQPNYIQEALETAKWIMSRPYMSISLGDPIKAREDQTRLIAQELKKAYSQGLQKGKEEERERGKQILTTKVNKEEMLDGWEKWWKNIGGERYVENCMECENATRIIESLTNKEKIV